jgi:hypothetical protein
MLYYVIIGLSLETRRNIPRHYLQYYADVISTLREIQYRHRQNVEPRLGIKSHHYSVQFMCNALLTPSD